jgi:hypothetical protein
MWLVEPTMEMLTEEFCLSSKYQEYKENAERHARKQLRIFNDSPFRNDKSFKGALEKIRKNIVFNELVNYQHKEQNAHFNADWDIAVGSQNNHSEYSVRCYAIEQQINDLCYWGESHAY